MINVLQEKVPDTMPPLFAAIYTPIAAAGTQGQIKHVARLLATQLNAAGLGPGAALAKSAPIVSLIIILVSSRTTLKLEL